MDAPFADTRKRPLIILSHGTGGSAAQLSWLAESLVANGFLVAGINHHGNTAAEETSWPHGFALPGEQARDISMLIVQLLKDGEIAPRIDGSRIGAAGSSIGGYSALASAGAHLKVAEMQSRCENESSNPVCKLPPEAGFDEADLQVLASSDITFKKALARDEHPVKDPRVRAVYVNAPAFLSLMVKQDFSLLDVPTRIVLAEKDQRILVSDTLDAVKEGIPDAVPLPVPNAGHYSFLASCSFRGKVFLRALCMDSSGVDRGELHRRIGVDAATFFNASV